MAKKSKKGKKSPAQTKQEKIAEAVFNCRDRSGRIRPKEVVDVARDPDNILHNEFEWDPEKNIQANLERQAADLIRRCREFIQYEDRVIVFPKFISDPTTDDSAYVHTVAIARNATLKTRALEAELARIKSAITRASSLAIVFNLQDRFEAMLTEIINIEEEIRKAA